MIVIVMEGKPPNKWEGLFNSSAERSLEDTLRFLMSVNLSPADFIGTKDDGYKLTINGKNNVFNLASLVELDYKMFLEPIPDRDWACLYFANKKREFRVLAEAQLMTMKTNREATLKPQGMGLPSFLTEEGNNEGDNNSNNA